MKALVFEGGGILACGQAALLHAFVSKGLINIKDFSVFVGTSGGAINAAALSLGFSIGDLVDLWIDSKEEDIMPKKSFFNFFGKRENKIDSFVSDKIIKKAGYKPDTTVLGLYNFNKKELYTVATCLQNNKGIIFGHDYHNIPICNAVKFSTSHPIKFDTNTYEYKGQVYDLTDGGLIQNCPVAVIANRSDIDEVVVISVSLSKDKETKKRYTSTFSVMERIISGVVERNEYMSYSYGSSIWKNKFKMINIVLDEDIDIFDMSVIAHIIERSYNYGLVNDFSNIVGWVPKNVDGFMSFGSF